MLLLTVSAALALTVDEVPNPAHDASWVSDTAGVISDGDEALLNGRIDSLNTDLGVEIAVVTVDDVPGVPKDFTTQLFEHWGVGDAHGNNGLLVLLVVHQRRLEMETGYGLEPVLPDGWLGLMQTQQMVPRFREGDYGAGMVAGMVAIDQRLRSDPGQVSDGSGGAVTGPTARSFLLSPWLGRGLIGLVLSGLAFLGWRTWRRRRHRWRKVCLDCDRDMELLPEEEEDEHLSEGQQAEERLGAGDWQVWRCPACGIVELEGVADPESLLKPCPQCGQRTMASGIRLVELATAQSQATMEVEERCHHCGHEAKRTERPKKISQHLGAFDAGYDPFGATSSGSTGGRRRSRSSFGSSSSHRSSSSRSSSRSRSSSSRGSFGGGRSGGGGAGSSW